jgi:hypothetical protein
MSGNFLGLLYLLLYVERSDKNDKLAVCSVVSEIEKNNVGERHNFGEFRELLPRREKQHWSR